MNRKLANTELQTLDALAIAFAAQRANGTFYNEKHHWVQATLTQVPVTTNHRLMFNHVTTIKPLDVTAQDHIDAQAARAFLTDYHVMATLQETHMSPWTQSLIAEVKTDVTKVRSLKLLAYTPDQVVKLTAKKATLETTQLLNYTSRHIGNVGERLEIAVTVLDKRYVEKFGCYFVFGYTPDNNCVGFFTSKDDYTTSGIYTGKVKRHNIDSYRNGLKVTEFNYVKPALQD